MVHTTPWCPPSCCTRRRSVSSRYDLRYTCATGGTGSTNWRAGSPLCAGLPWGGAQLGQGVGPGSRAYQQGTSLPRRRHEDVDGRRGRRRMRATEGGTQPSLVRPDGSAAAREPRWQQQARRCALRRTWPQTPRTRPTRPLCVLTCTLTGWPWRSSSREGGELLPLPARGAAPRPPGEPAPPRSLPRGLVCFRLLITPPTLALTQLAPASGTGTAGEAQLPVGARSRQPSHKHVARIHACVHAVRPSCSLLARPLMHLPTAPLLSPPVVKLRRLFCAACCTAAPAAATPPATALSLSTGGSMWAGGGAGWGTLKNPRASSNSTWLQRGTAGGAGRRGEARRASRWAVLDGTHT